MKKFEFKLEPVLNYREYLEKVAQQKTAKAHMDVKNCEGNISSLSEIKKGNANQMDSAVSKGISASLFRQYCRYQESVEYAIKQEKMRKIKLEKVLKRKLLELKKKSIDKKAMEVYQDRLKAQYTQELLRSEQKELDEISSLKTARMLSDDTK